MYILARKYFPVKAELKNFTIGLTWPSHALVLTPQQSRWDCFKDTHCLCVTSNKGQQSDWKRAVSDVHGPCLRQRHLSGPSLVIWRTHPLASPLVTRQRSVAWPLCRIQASNKGQRSNLNHDVTATQVALRPNPAAGLKKETTQVVLFIFNEAHLPFWLAGFLPSR